jgi:hypothetical protein
MKFTSNFWTQFTKPTKKNKDNINKHFLKKLINLMFCNKMLQNLLDFQVKC